MQYGWDNAKNARNVDKHGVSFEAVRDFEWDDAMVRQDVRKDYGEVRKIALGLIHGRVFYCAFVDRADHRRIISLRKANNREIRKFNGDSMEDDMQRQAPYLTEEEDQAVTQAALSDPDAQPLTDAELKQMKRVRGPQFAPTKQ